MGCMKEKPTYNEVCPFCGFDETRHEIALHHLPPRTILAAKLLVGRVLGEGGFGITYIGYDLNLNLPVAIKEFYPSGFASRESSVSVTVSAFQGKMGDVFNDGKSKFVEEARRLARFRNLPGIVAVNDFIMENGTAYIVMEYIEGITLKAHLARIGGRMRTEEVLSLMRPVMESLAKMHEADLIHRDISPDNIMISTMGEIRLIDFGAARSFAGDVNKSLSILLKPGYAPIEQYSSKGMQGPFTDVYAICATIYKAITGETPTESSDRVSEDIVTPPSDLGADIDPHREQVLLKGMELLAKNRYQTIGELMGELYSATVPTASTPQNVYRPSAPVEEPKSISQLGSSQSEPPSEPRSISQLQPTPQPAPQLTPQPSAPTPPTTAVPKSKLKPFLPLIAVGVVFLVVIVYLVMPRNVTPPEELFSNNNFTSQEEGFEADEQPTDDFPENDTTDGASFEITPEEGAELEMLIRTSDSDPLLTAQLENYTAMTGVETELMLIESVQYDDHFTAMLASNDLPDVLAMNSIELKFKEQYGVFAPLDDYLSSEVRADFDSKLLEVFTGEDGNLYGLPYSYNVMALFYNRDLLEEAGIEVTESFEEFFVNSFVFAERGTPALMVNLNSTYLFPFFYSARGTLYENGAPVLYNEGNVFAMNLFTEMYQVGGMQTSEQSEHTSSFEAFQQGNVPFIVALSAAANDFAQYDDLNFGVAPIPYINNPASMFYSEAYVASNNSSYPNAAAGLMLYLTEAQQVMDMVSYSGQTPARRSAHSEYFSLYPELEAVPEILPSATHFYFGENHVEFISLAIDAIALSITGEGTPEENFAEYQAYIDELGG